jgi:hypothetical protein
VSKKKVTGSKIWSFWRKQVVGAIENEASWECSWHIVQRSTRDDILQQITLQNYGCMLSLTLASAD